MRSLDLFNNTGDVGKTTLTFHLAHSLAYQGYRVAALDCDPQCNLSAVFLGEETLFDIWQDETRGRTRPGLRARSMDVWISFG